MKKEKKPITQADLKKMARLHELWLEGKPDGQRADFSGMEMDRLDFDGMTFEAATFNDARISSCDLCCNLMCADFRGAEIRDSFTGYSSFESADLTDAKCYYCDFTRAQFDGAHLRRAVFDNCDFTHAKMECCDMTAAKFTDTTFHWTATAGSWGGTPPARDAETLEAEADFTAGMLGLGIKNTGKIAEWMDEAWSQAQDHTCGYEPKPGPREPEYRERLEGYAAAFAQARAQFPTATETLYEHGEHFSPEEIPATAAQLAEGSSMDTVLSMEIQGLLRPENAGDLANLKEIVGLVIEDTLSSPEDGEALLYLGALGRYYGLKVNHEFSLLDLLSERREVASARLDFDENAIMLELTPEFLMEQAPGMAMRM